MDVCFMCTKDYHCVPVDDRIVSEVEYLIPEITIIKLGIPLCICVACEGALDAFSKFKHSSVESSRRLESSIRARGAPGPPLHTDRAPVVGHNDTSGTQPQEIEAVYIKEEPVEETWPECHPHINSASLNSALRVDRTSPDTYRALPNPQNLQNQLKSQTSSRIDFFTDSDNTENVSIKEELLKDTLQGQELYKNVKENICKADYAESNTMSNNKDNESEHKTEEENSRADTREEVWEKSSTEPEEMVVKDNIKNYSKSDQIDTKKRTLCNKNLKTTCRSEHRSKINNKLFIRKANLSRHKKKVHRRLKQLPCVLCKQIFIHKYDLNRHVVLHNGIKNFQCYICKTRFFKKHYLSHHLNTHNGQKDFRGNTCTKTIASETELKSRSTEQESIRVNKEEYRCEICSKLFTRKLYLSNHMKEHSRRFDCNVCSKLFSQKSYLRSHMKIHSATRKYQCDVCRKLFTHKYHLRRHLKVHSGIKDYQCNVCSKSFTQNWNLNQHMKIHLGIKEHKCVVCFESFTHKHDLKAHIKIHPDIKNQHCDVCKKSFSRKYHLQRHMKIHADIKDHHCNVCNKSFTQKIHLQRHIKIHSDIKDQHCDVCNKSFRQKNYLRRHMKIHLDIKDQHCNVCNKSFRQKHHLQSHLKIHSKKK